MSIAGVCSYININILNLVIQTTVKHFKNLQLISSLFLLSTSLLILALISKATAEIPEPECETALNEQACGYNCERSNDGRVAGCAEWPGGKCTKNTSSVTCGPPAPDNWQDEYESSNDFDDIRDRDRYQDCDCDCDR